MTSTPFSGSEWELGLQLFDDEFADRFAFDVLDPTKIIPTTLLRPSSSPGASSSVSGPASTARLAPGLVNAQGDHNVMDPARRGPLRTEGRWHRKAPGRSGTACSASISTIISRARPLAPSWRTGGPEPIARPGQVASSSAWRPRSHRTAPP